MDNYACNQTVLQNLKDAGCDESMITILVDSLEKGKMADGLLLLGKYRNTLLDKIHTGQKQIDCLDYLIYQINK